MGIFAGKGVMLRYSALALGFGYLSIRGGMTSSLWSMTCTYASVNYAMIAYFTHNNSNTTHWIGKDPDTGTLPIWSYAIWFPFHMINQVFANIARVGSGSLANEIRPNYFLGSWHAYQLEKEWEAVLDLTCELPKLTNTSNYLNLPSWDGNIHLKDIQRAAEFVARHAENGPVLVHCAHGIGRSTTMMRAALVEAGIAQDINEAFQIIKERRSVAKSSPKFQSLLEKWQHSR